MKHIDDKIKLMYIHKYLNGTKNVDICKLMIENNHAETNNIKTAKSKFYRWLYNYRSIEERSYDDYMKTKNINKNRKQKNINYKKYTYEELIEINEIKDKFIEDLINENKKKQFMRIHLLKDKTILSLNKLCDLFEVSKPGYYKWTKTDMSTNRKYCTTLSSAIKHIYLKYRGNYGYKRVWVALRRDLNVIVSLNTVIRYMKHLGLKAEIRQKRKRCERKSIQTNIPYLIKRNFKGDKPFEKMYTDVSYIETKNGWNYISATIDGYNNEMIDIKSSNRNNLDLVMNNMNDTLKNFNSSNLIINSDHGVHYTSKKYTKLLKDKNIKPSMSRKSKPIDNRNIEYLFSTFKQEWWRLIPSKERTTERLKEEIEKFKHYYNNIRFQSNLGNKTPVEYRLENA